MTPSILQTSLVMAQFPLSQGSPLGPCLSQGSFPFSLQSVLTNEQECSHQSGCERELERMVGERQLVRSGVHIPVTEWAQEVHSLPTVSVSGGAAPEPLGPVPQLGSTAGKALTVRTGTVSLKHTGHLPLSRAYCSFG